MRVLLCCEGVTDYGRQVYQGDEYSFQDGVIQILIKKVSKVQNIEFATKSRQDIAAVRVKNVDSKNNKIAKALSTLADKENCTFIAFHRDEDNNGFEEMYNQVEAFLRILRENPNYKCISIVPMHMTESWLLADERAFDSVPKKPKLPKDPEDTWGNKGTANHPKKYLERVLAQFQKSPSSDTYAEIARKCEVEVLKEKCSISFGRFYNDMQAFLPAEAGTQ